MVKSLATNQSILFRALVVWFVIIATETINGAIREIFITPVIGDTSARRISFGIAIVLITFVTLSLIRWVRAPNAMHLLAMGLLWASLTLIFEVGISATLGGSTWQQIVADYDPSAGGLMLFGLVYLSVVPILASSISGGSRSEDVSNE